LVAIILIIAGALAGSYLLISYQDKPGEKSASIERSGRHWTWLFYLWEKEPTIFDAYLWRRSHGIFLFCGWHRLYYIDRTGPECAAFYFWQKIGLVLNFLGLKPVEQ
jgi:hypothetical protein